MSMSIEVANAILQTLRDCFMEKDEKYREYFLGELCSIGPSAIAEAISVVVECVNCIREKEIKEYVDFSSRQIKGHCSKCEFASARRWKGEPHDHL